MGINIKEFERRLAEADAKAIAEGRKPFRISGDLLDLKPSSDEERLAHLRSLLDDVMHDRIKLISYDPGGIYQLKQDIAELERKLASK